MKVIIISLSMSDTELDKFIEKFERSEEDLENETGQSGETISTT